LLLLCMSLRGVSSESAGTAKRRREVPMNLWRYVFISRQVSCSRTNIV
jgi:hypothetical protein